MPLWKKKLNSRGFLLTFPGLFSVASLFLLRRVYAPALLFESIIASIFVTLLVLFAVFLIFKCYKLMKFESLICIFLSLSIFYSISFSTIMNTDRSKSLYVLSWIHDQGPITEANLAKLLEKKYGQYDSAYISQRILEQTRRGVFKINDGEISVTELGRIYWNCAEVFALVFNLTGWYTAKIDAGGQQ